MANDNSLEDHLSKTGNPRAMKMNIKNLHERFCTERKIIKNFTDDTIRWYKCGFTNFLTRSSIPIEFIEDVNTTVLEKFLYDGRINNDWTSQTFICYYKALKVFFDWCVKKGYLKSNPISPIELPKMEQGLPKRITQDEAMKLLEYSYYKLYRYRFQKYRNRAIIGLYLFTGIRSKELLNLKLADVDLEQSTLQIKLGKGNKDRVIPICEKLKMILSEYIDDRNKLKRQCINLLTSTGKDTPFTDTGLKRFINALKRVSKIEFSPHRLRHTFATLMLEGGCDLFSLQKMMGHSDIKTTTIYLSATVKHLQAQIIKHPLG